MLSVLPLDLNTVTGLISFGNNLPETKNPTLEYYTNSPDVVLKAVCGGTIGTVTLNPNPAVPDYSISIKHRANSSWTIIYDHIKNPAVKVGDVVVAGANLGTVGRWKQGRASDKQNGSRKCRYFCMSFVGS